MSTEHEIFTLAAYLGCQGLWLWLQAQQHMDPPQSGPVQSQRVRSTRVPTPRLASSSLSEDMRRGSCSPRVLTAPLLPFPVLWEALAGAPLF